MNQLKKEFLVINPCEKDQCHCKEKCNECDKCKSFCGKLELYSIKELRGDVLDYFGEQLVNKSKKIEGYRIELRDNKSLMDYLGILDSMILAARYDDKYLDCDHHFELLKLKVMKIIGIIRVGFEIERTDITNLQSWILKNPLCIGLEYWEKALYDIPFVFQLEVKKITKKTKDIIFSVMRLEKPKRDVLFEVIKRKKLVKDISIDVKKIKSAEPEKITVKTIEGKKLDVVVDVKLVGKGSGEYEIGLDGEKVLLTQKELVIISKIL